MNQQRFEGVDRSIDGALGRAVRKIPPRHGRDIAVGRVVEIGVQRGGFIDELLYYAIVEEDLNAPARTIDDDR